MADSMDIVVTHHQATLWLAKIGGTWLESKGDIPGAAKIVVTVDRAMGGTVSRHAVFDDRLTGYLRDLAVREAFANACRALRSAIA